MKAFLAIKRGEEKSVVLEDLRTAMNKEGLDEVVNPEEADIIFSVGGDGTLLYNIQHYLNLGKPFVGVNAGSVGYLCLVQKETIGEDLSRVLKSKPHTFSAFSITTEELKEVAIAEVRVERLSHDCVRMKIVNNGETLAKKHMGDGIIITNSLGSTGYNDSAGGHVLPINDRSVVITPICPYRRGGELYDSILKPKVHSNINLEIVTDQDARLVLENRSYTLTSRSPVNIVYGEKQYSLYVQRKDERKKTQESLHTCKTNELETFPIL